MRFLLGLAALAVTGCAAAPAPASPASPVAASAAEAPKAGAAKAETAQADPEKKICRKMMETGSNYPKRVCSTAAEWAKFERQGREGAERFDEQRRAGGITGDTEGGGP